MSIFYLNRERQFTPQQRQQVKRYPEPLGLQLQTGALEVEVGELELAQQIPTLTTPTGFQLGLLEQPFHPPALHRRQGWQQGQKQHRQQEKDLAKPHRLPVYR